MNTSHIIDYYDYTLPFYQHFWYRNSDSYAIHYGFWEKDTKSLKEALLNTNRFLADKAKIKPKDVILDAGCGIGGSTIWLAKNFKTKVVGISLSKKQIDKAKELAKKNNSHAFTNFYVINYLNTRFDNNSFDVIWAVESVCHAENKKDFLNEAFRLLRKKGRIVVADGFLKRKPINKNEAQIYNDFLKGLVLPGLDTIKQFGESLKIIGFKNIRFWDKTGEVLPSAKKLYRMCKIGYPLAKAGELLHITPPILTKNNLAGIAQYKGLELGFGAYGVFYAEK